MNTNDIIRLKKSLKISDEELLKIWFEVYVLSKDKEDLHSKFGLILCIPRGDAKVMGYYTLYLSPYLKHILRCERISVLNHISRMISKTPTKQGFLKKVKNNIDYLENLATNYINTFRK